jgi:hypothetical protein
VQISSLDPTAQADPALQAPPPPPAPGDPGTSDLRAPGSGGGHHHHHGGGHVALPDDALLQQLQGTSSTDATPGTSITDVLQQVRSSPASGTSTSSGGATRDPSVQNLLDQLNGSSSTAYGADGTAPDLSGSLGLDARA